MRCACLTVLGGLILAPAWAAPPVTAAARAGIDHVIAAQIEAFRHDDGTAALAFATPALQAQFGDGLRFLDMVKAAYPIVFRPSSFSFGSLTPEGDRLEQKVEFVGANGQTALALYEMEQEKDGSWRIAGCILTKSERIDL